MSLSFCRNLKWWWQHTRRFIVSWAILMNFHTFWGREWRRSTVCATKYVPIFNLIQYNTIHLFIFKSLAANTFTLSAGDTKHISTIKRNSLCSYQCCSLLFFFLFFFAFDSHKRLWFVSLSLYVACALQFKLCTFDLENSLYTTASLTTTKCEQFNLPHFI